jgi:tetratricopeptide (TPR) repeat protein
MPTSAELDGLLEQARECLRRGDYQAAIDQFRLILETDNCQVSAHEGLATAAFLGKEYDLAIQHFRRVTQIDPRRSQALINMGAVYNRMAEYNNAVQVLRKALSKNRNSAEAYYNLGLAHRGLNQLSMAVSAYKEAIRLKPTMAEAYQNLANIFVQMGNIDQAILHYRRALELRPGFERAEQGLDRARQAKQAAEKASSPFGRLVDVSKVRKSQESGSVRPMNDQERYDDRAAVYSHAKESKRAAIALLQLLEIELEEDLLEFTRAVNNSKDAQGLWEPYQRLAESIENFERLVGVLQSRTAALRAHEDDIARMTTAPAKT